MYSLSKFFLIFEDKCHTCAYTDADTDEPQIVYGPGIRIFALN